MDWSAAITLAIAVLGAVLGLLNTWHSIDNRRLKVRVRFLNVVALDDSIDAGIEVTNLSAFPLTIREVGMTLRRARGRPAEVLLIVPRVASPRELPARLEPREQTTVYFKAAELPHIAAELGKAYAKTTCGETFKGETGALKQLRESMRDRSA